MLPQTIALCGCKRVGKDTVANYLVAQYGYKNVKFAEPMKSALKALFGWTTQQVEDNKESIDPFWGVSPRHAMQFFGTDVMQFEIQRLLPHVGRDFFVKSLLSRHMGEHIVISDMRFLHEYNGVKQLADSIVIKIVKSETSDDGHVSETEASKIPADYIVHNDGSTDELYQKIENILRDYV